MGGEFQVSSWIKMGIKWKQEKKIICSLFICQGWLQLCEKHWRLDQLVELNLKGWQKCWLFFLFSFFLFFLTAHTLLHPGWFTPPIAIPCIEQALFEITTDLMYHNNSLITLQKIKHQSCEGLCFQSRGLRKRFTDAGLQNRDSAKQTYNEERWRLLSLSYE